MKRLIVAFLLFTATTASAVDRIRIDFDSPAPPLDLVASQDFSDGMTATVAGINAQIKEKNAAITAQNAIEAAKSPPGPVTPLLPLQTRNGYVASLMTPVIDATERATKETTLKDAIDKLKSVDRAKRDQAIKFINGL